MASSKLKLQKVKVSRDYHGYDTPTLYSFAHGTKFTGTSANTPPVGDGTVYSHADAMLATHTGRQTVQAKTATDTEAVQRNTLLNDLDQNANYLENAANNAAIAAGDAGVGKALISDVGFKVAGKGVHKAHYGVTKTGPGWVQAHEEKIHKGEEGHVWEFGTAANKTTPPGSTKQRFSLDSTVTFQHLVSGSIFAYREASIVPTRSKKVSGSHGTTAIPAPSTGKKASQLPMGPGKHTVIDVTDDNPYAFGDWRFAVVP